MGTNLTGIVGAVGVAAVVAMAFGIALGIVIGEPRHRSAQLHDGSWQWVGLNGTAAVWQRDEPRRQHCHDNHRPFVCTIVNTIAHVDACDCGMTREGVYGPWR